MIRVTDTPAVQLADLIVERRANKDTDTAFVFPTLAIASSCVRFLSSRDRPVPARIVQFDSGSSKPDDGHEHDAAKAPSASSSSVIDHLTVWAVVTAKTDLAATKQYWQHAGDNVSSRLAERFLSLLKAHDDHSTPVNKISSSSSTVEVPTDHRHQRAASASNALASRYAKNKHYAPRLNGSSSSPASHSPSATSPRLPPTASTSSITASAATAPGAAPFAAKFERYSGSVSRSRRSSASSETGANTLATSVGSLLDLDNGSRVPAGGDIRELDESDIDDSEEEDDDALSRRGRAPHANAHTAANGDEDATDEVLERYVEERYGRNLDLQFVQGAKLAMRRRVAGVFRADAANDGNVAGHAQETSSRGIEGLSEHDVWLYPTGMSAIFHSHQLLMHTAEAQGRQVGKSVMFGFPYTDTLKILQKWGPGAHFFGQGLNSELAELRDVLARASPPILAIYCEFPSNPLLRSPPLKELRKLADEFGCAVVVDETVAGFVNVETLPCADIVVSSLTKIFSGDANVMGGSLCLNPGRGAEYDARREAQSRTYEDAYYAEDAIYLERNSRDFVARVAKVNRNTEALCDFLRAKRQIGPFAHGISSEPAPTLQRSAIKEVYYPKFMTRDNYDALKRHNVPESGYGSLFSVTFHTPAAASAFYDALGCYKGPSLGTNFTLACPYTILAHYTELEWASGFGVESLLVRVSVGLEDQDTLRAWFEHALDAADNAA